MRVVSALADIEFQVGEIERQGHNLVVHSSDQSTLETRITISPKDALATLKKLLLSPSAIWFLLTSPFSGLRGSGDEQADSWESRRQTTGLNKPW